MNLVLCMKSHFILKRHIFYYCAGWGYIVAFSEILTIYHIYHTWIHLLHHSPLSLSTHAWDSFNRFHFSMYIHMYTVFAPYSPHPPLSHWYQLSRQDQFCPPVLWFCKKIKVTFLFKIAERGDVFMYICIATWIGSSLR
jgi:hypothetical protein